MCVVYQYIYVLYDESGFGGCQSFVDLHRNINQLPPLAHATVWRSQLETLIMSPVPVDIRK